MHAARTLLFVLLAWAAGAMCAGAALAQTLEVKNALQAPGSRAALDDPALARTVPLPDEWAQSMADRPKVRGPVWYRIELPGLPLAPEAAEQGDLMAIYIEHVCSNYVVWLNGERIHSGGRMGKPYTHQCNHPQLVALPAALLEPRGNRIEIEVVGHPLAEVGSRQRAGALSPVLVGPQEQLALRHARQTALQVTAPQAVSATLVLMGGFMFVLGFINRSESHLAYFGALSVGWALIDMRLWVRQWPFGHSVMEFALVALLGFIAWAAVQFLLRYAGTRLRGVDVAMPVQCAVLAASLVLAGAERLHTVASFWYVVLALEVAAAGVWHLKHLQRDGTPGSPGTGDSHADRGLQSVWVMAWLLFTATLAGMIEFAAQWSGTRPLAAHIAQLVVPVVFVLVGLRLVQQHGRALQEAQQGKAVLEQRVREATAEIEKNLRQMSELRVEQVTERERKRIAADLHDDLGAKLLTIVHTSESERISTLAREALEEMRLSVRGLTGRPVRLADALGDWRAEVVSRLAQAGIEGDWDAPEDLPHTLSARAYVQTTRILREATSNIIKHSRASNCSVTAGIADGDFQLVVQDNGDGISSEIDGRLDRGHGLASMKNRAKQLQGQCLVESGRGWGTVIRLTVPLERATLPT